MADNITAPGAGSVLATDEIAGVHYPRNKIGFGAEGSYSDVSTAAGLPVADATTATKLDAVVAAIGEIAAGGDATAENQVIANAALADIAGLLGAPLDVAGTFYPPTQPVSAEALPLPAGAATAARQDAIVAALGETLDVAVAGPVAVTGDLYPETQPISATALPLPAGAATSAKQDTATAAVENLGTAKRWFAIAPADSNLATVPDCIYVGVAGTVVARGDDDVDATFTATAGAILPIRPKQVRASSTATGLIGLVN